MAERKTITQCASCPWRVGCDPTKDIPNGYSVELHKGLRKTIGGSLSDALSGQPMHAMACHYSKPGEEHACAGWLANQLGAGNNIGVRLAVLGGRLPVPVVEGPQHETFEATIPKAPRRRATRKRG